MRSVQSLAQSQATRRFGGRYISAYCAAFYPYPAFHRTRFALNLSALVGILSGEATVTPANGLRACLPFISASTPGILPFILSRVDMTENSKLVGFVW